MCPTCVETHWICSTCTLVKPHAEFSKNANSLSGYHGQCKSCQTSQSQKNLYGLSFGEYEQMLLDQANVCAICLNPPTETRRLCVDHDHKTGMVRGLLCGPCNTGLGHLRDNPKVILAAADYLFERSPTIADEDRNVRVQD